MERSGGHSERRRQILDAALRVFSERGFGGASIRAIATEAGLNSPPLVYWYFSSKRDLFSEMLARFSQRAPAFGFGDQLHREPEAVLPELARAELRAFEDPALVRLLRVAVAESAMNPAEGERFSGIFRGEALEFLTRYLELWGKRRGVEGLRPGIEARAFFGSLFFYVLNREVFSGLGDRLPDAEEYADSVARRLVERYGAAADPSVARTRTTELALPPGLARAGVVTRGESGRVEAEPGVLEDTLERDATETGPHRAGAGAPQGPPDDEAAGAVTATGGAGIGGGSVAGVDPSSADGAGGVSEGAESALEVAASREAGGEPFDDRRGIAEGEGRQEPADPVSRLFEDLTRDTPKFVPLEDQPPDPPRPAIPLFDSTAPRRSGAAERADEPSAERQPETARREPAEERPSIGEEESGEVEGPSGRDAPALEPNAGRAPLARQPFPAEPPPREPRRDALAGGERPVAPPAARGGVRKALFFVLPVRGHVQAALPVARELASRGEEVVFYATEEFEGLVRGAGVGFRALDGDFALPVELSEGYLSAPRDMRPSVIRSIADSLRGVGRLAGWAREEAADYAVYDPLCPWGRPVSDALGLPAVGLYTTFVARENSPLARRLLPNLEGTPPPALVMQMVRLRWELREARSALGLPDLRPRDLLLRPADLNIVTLPDRFQPSTGGALDERFVFVGPSILQRDERAYFSLKQIETQPTVFVSLGSSYDEGTAKLYGDCMEAFASSRWLVVMETGPGADPALLGQAPPNVIAWPRVPRLEVLRRCDVFVTDGDVGATMEALWFGVPLVVVPRTPEQGIMAERVDELDTGLVLDPKATGAEDLRQAVDAVGADPSYHSGLADLWVAARHAGGHRLAGDEIQAFVARARERA